MRHTPRIAPFFRLLLGAAVVASVAACDRALTDPPSRSLTPAAGPRASLEDPEPWHEASDPVLALDNFAPGTPTNNPRIQIPPGFVNFDCESMFYVMIGEMDRIVSYTRTFNKKVRATSDTWGLNYPQLGAAVQPQRYDMISAGIDFGIASIIFTDFGCLDIYENVFAPVYVAAARQARTEYYQWSATNFSGPAPWLAWFPASMNGF